MKQFFAKSKSLCLAAVLFTSGSFAEIKLVAKPPAKTTTITVKNVDELMSTEATTKSGNVTVLIEDGTYEMPKGLWLTGKQLTYKSKSGNRDKVILKGSFKTSHILGSLMTM